MPQGCSPCCWPPAGGGNDYSPKPQAYLRIDLPPHVYTVYDTAALSFTFERSGLTEVVFKKDRRDEKWIDLRYPQHKGYVFLTYKELHGPKDLAGQVDTSMKFLENHYAYCTGIDERQFVDRQHRIFGTTYHLKGQNVASTYQFWATDSTRHFLRGSLYIDCTPNNDSLAPEMAINRQLVSSTMRIRLFEWSTLMECGKRLNLLVSQCAVCPKAVNLVVKLLGKVFGDGFFHVKP